MWLFAGYNGCESGHRGCGCFGCVGWCGGAVVLVWWRWSEV